MLRTLLALVVVPCAIALAAVPAVLEALVVPHLRDGQRLGQLDAIVAELVALRDEPAVPCRVVVMGSSQSREAFDGVAIGAATGCDVYNLAYSSATPVSDLALLPLVLEAHATHVIVGYSAFSLSRCFALPPRTLEILGRPAAAAISRARNAELEDALGPLVDEIGGIPRVGALREDLWPALLDPPATADPTLRPGYRQIRLRDPWIYTRTMPLAEIEAGAKRDNPLATAFTRPDCLGDDAERPNRPARAIAAMRALAAKRGTKLVTVRLPVHAATQHFIRPEHEADVARIRATWPAGSDLDWTDDTLSATLIDSTHVGAAGRALITERARDWLAEVRRAVP